MPDEDETQPWLTESIAQLDRVRISQPLPAQELRRRGIQRRQRRARSSVIAATAGLVRPPGRRRDTDVA
ncbi:hypothetical protein [Streptomyces sp. NPDC050263]|uniref:hypothetical protein n=1 Tax=Streptomyces sp. NPDC050263 TaxID=3155037 RepID=UPI003443913C